MTTETLDYPMLQASDAAGDAKVGKKKKAQVEVGKSSDFELTQTFKFPGKRQLPSTENTVTSFISAFTDLVSRMKRSSSLMPSVGLTLDGGAARGGS